MRHARVDDNHGEIVAAIRSVKGCSVQSLAGVGDGVPDLLIGARGRTYLVEVKDGSKPISRRCLTPAQIQWRYRWNGKLPITLMYVAEASKWARHIAGDG